MISIIVIALSFLLLLGILLGLVKALALKKQVEKLISLSHLPLNNPSPILCADDNAKIVFANPASQFLLSAWKRKQGEVLPDNISAWVSRVAQKKESQSATLKIDSIIYYFSFVPDKISNTIGIYAQDITQGKKIEQDLIKSTIYDLVTNLPNRALFYDYLKLELAHKRTGYKVFVMVIKLIDYVSIINRYGDVFCRKLLNLTRLQLKRFLSEDATLAKLGEKDFGIIESVYFEESQVVELCRKIIAYFDDPLWIDQTEVISRVAIGVSYFPQDGSTHEILLRNAKMAQQKALLESNRFSFYQMGMDTQIESKRNLLLDLHNALEQNAFSIFYQPQGLFSSGERVGAEALIRWTHPVLGAISPLAFLPVAESTGLIIPIGKWITETVFRDLARWQSSDPKKWATCKIAINLSAVQFQHAGLIPEIKALLLKYNLSPHNIEFEITESILVRNMEETIKKMKALRDTGFSLSIDDFGTGYSSLSYLKNLPVQKLKIDKAFIDDIEHHEPSLAMVKSIIELGHNLGLKVLAEGVESKVQFEMLKALECDLIQGYYFSKPISAEAFEQFTPPPQNNS